MRRSRSLSLTRIAIAGVLLAFSSPAARCQNSAGNAGFTQVPTYNPYPLGILPPDLDPEIARVQREMRSIFNEALTEWRQVPSPKVKGNPPILQGRRTKPSAGSSIPQSLSIRTQALVLPERYRSDSGCGGSDSSGA
jgi:hypothetical protein